MRSIVSHFLLLNILATQTLCKQCPPLTPVNVDKFCDYPGEGIVSCEPPYRPGTRANLTCRPFFEYLSATDPYPPHREIICLENGTWDPPPFNCSVPECGSTTLAGYNQMFSRRAELGTFPWHVAVYQMNWVTGQLERICGGSLISTELVVTAAHCFYDETKHRLQDARDYAVAAGQLSSSYYTEEDYRQISRIQKIYVPDGYRGNGNKQLKDIAIVRLDQSFEITSFVRTVCVDLSNTYAEKQLSSKQVGKLMGWGIKAKVRPSEELQAIDLPYIDHHLCQQKAPENLRDYVTSDKICAGYLDESSTCGSDNGGGLCFRSNGRWYLHGILSVISHIKEGNEYRCNDRYYNAFTNVANYTHWIESVMIDVGNSLDGGPQEINDVRSCILPEPPTGGNFKHELCRGSFNYVPGITLPMGSTLEYNCEKGYSLQGNRTSICRNAVWSPRPTCIMLKYCPSLPSSDGLHTVCQRGDKIVSCKHHVAPRTKATLQCKDNYRMNSNNDHSPSIEITCSANGTWNRNPAVYRCTPDGIHNMRPCIMPEPPTHGNFEHEICAGSCNYVPGFTFPIASILEYNCEKGYSLQGNSTSICQNAVWSSRPTCIELKYCPPIPSLSNLNAVCQHDDLIVSCEFDVVPGTKATLRCDSNYRMNSDGDNSRLIGITCSADGTWNTNPASYRCNPECGIAPETDDVTDFVNETEIYVGDVPWPVFICRKRGEERKRWFCVGKLVKPDLVILRGLCENDLGFNDVRQDMGEFRVVDTFDGLLMEDFENSRSYHQKHSVKNYRVHDDVMVLRLKTPFVSKRYVSPLCMDWSLELDLPHAGELGMTFVSIRSKTSSRKMPDHKLSRYATRVIGNKECQLLLGRHAGQITRHQFCVELPSDWWRVMDIDVNVAVRRNGKWYLAGVGHTSCYNENYTRRFITVTKIGWHMNWIKQVEKDL